VSAAAIIVPTGGANIASVAAGLRRAGVEADVSSSAREIERAERVILPGVGAFGPAMERLRRDGCIDPLIARIQAGRPLLAICLGLQLLCRESEESPEVRGLGIIDARIDRFGPNIRAPQFGWNTVEADRSCALIHSGCAYFANSYKLAVVPDGWSAAWSDHGGPFVAALERGKVLACQFHPELSGEWGLALLQRWATSREGVRAW
jgi:imidazole glycerol phosphate synthase glutamine amidotransferase subunit